MERIYFEKGECVACYINKHKECKKCKMHKHEEKGAGNDEHHGENHEDKHEEKK